MTRDVDFLDALHRTDPWIAAITSERIQGALRSFPLSFSEGWDFPRLTCNIQDVAGIGRIEPPQSYADARKDLNRLAHKARALAESLCGIGDTASFEILWQLAPRNSEGSSSGSASTEDFERLIIQPLTESANLFEVASSQIGLRRPQLPRWREKQRQERRVGFALSLMPIFRSAFGIATRADNWQFEYDDEPCWPDFFRRIWRELYPDADKLNLSEVLQEAARLEPQIAEAINKLTEATRVQND